jgi:hypothetical protein
MTSEITPDAVRAALEAATPGPWEQDGIAISNTQAYPLDVCLMGEPLQYAGDVKPMLQNHESNARLIAMAPDLATAYLAMAEDHERLRARVEAADRLVLTAGDVLEQADDLDRMCIPSLIDLEEKSAAYRATEERG